MTLFDELNTEVKSIFANKWSQTKGYQVPDLESLALGNHSKQFEATMLYADLNGSTHLVDSMPTHFAAEVYKSYVLCAVRIIKQCDGHIRSFDGDRVMAIFMGDNKNTNAAKCGLRLNGAVSNIINPAIEATYKGRYNGRYDYKVSHTVGIDTSEISAVRIGIKGTNDIVWVGKAANHAAKLAAIPSSGSYVYITPEVHKMINKTWKFSSKNEGLWQPWLIKSGFVYRSGWRYYDF